MKMARLIFMYILLIMIMVLVAILVVLMVSLIQGLSIPSESMLWTFDSPGKYTIFITILFVEVFMLGLFYSIRKIDNRYMNAMRVMIRYKVIFLLVFFSLTYIQVTSVTVFTETSIIHHGLVRPFGIEYQYGDIRSVRAGVYDKRIPIIRERGQFFYIIGFKDGTKVDLMDIGGHTGSADPYARVEQIDGIIMDHGAEKSSSDENIALVDLNTSIVNCFQRIISNK